MQLDIVNLSNQKVGVIDLSDAVFACPVRLDILNQVVKWQLAKRQAGTHKTKGISEVSGTGAKPHRQKGTGRARFGSLRTPQHRGGATIFGPVVRSHAHKLPKKVRAMGLRCALSGKAAAQDLIIMDSLDIASDKTRDLIAAIKSITIEKILFVDVVSKDQKGPENFMRASSNIMHLNFIPSHGLNVHDILRHSKLAMTKAAAQELEERLK